MWHKNVQDFRQSQVDSNLLKKLNPVEEFRKARSGQNENFEEILHSKFSYGVKVLVLAQSRYWRF
jgi:hypothetical protein